MHPLLKVASNAARAAGRVAERAFNDFDLLKVEEKSQNDFVTAADRAVEEKIIHEIRQRYPESSFIGEESGFQGKKDAEMQWIIDPIDGTTNFIRGIPQFAISIACRVNGRIEHGVIYDPAKDEEFTASRGAGARLNGKRIRVRDMRSLRGALLATGIPFNKNTLMHLDAYLDCTRDLLRCNTCGVRRMGAASLDLAYVAAGRFDGFYEMNLKPWDMAAGILLVREAGGLVTDLNGGERYLETGHILCGAPRVFRDMLPIVQKHLGDLVAPRES